MADRFQTIYDVTEQGADPSGTEITTSAIQDLVQDDTLLRFPPGTYLFDDLAIKDVTNFGMVGTDATLELIRQGRAIFLGCRHVSDVLIDGFTIDATADNTTAWCDFRCVGGQNVVRNYTVEGFGDVENRTNGFTLMVEGEDTSLELDTVDISDGAINGAATFVFPQREFYDPTRKAGSLTFRDCVMKGWGKEGLYASAHRGPLRVIGGEYANNAIVQVRVGGGDESNRAVVRDVSVTVDNVPDYTPSYNRVLRGIWLKEGDRAIVENCDVTIANVDESDTPGGIVVNNQFGRATIRDCSVTIDDVSRPALSIRRPTDRYRPDYMPSLDQLPAEWDVTVENLTVDSESSDSESIRIHRRDGCTVRDATIENSGSEADGINLMSVNQCTIDGGSVSASRHPVVIEFDDDDDCVLSLSDVSISMNTSESEGSLLSNARNGEFCVGNGAGTDDSHSDSDTLALTRTERFAQSGNNRTSQESEMAYLYGRWVTE